MTRAAQLDAELVDAEEHVSAFARAVAMKRAAITAVAGGLLVLAASRGWITPSLSGAVRADLNAGLDFLTVVGAGAWIHRAVTPAKQALQPVNSAGQLLVPDPSAATALASATSSPAVGAAFDDAIAATLATGSHAAPLAQQPAAGAPFMQGGLAATDPAPPDASAMGGTDPAPSPEG